MGQNIESSAPTVGTTLSTHYQHIGLQMEYNQEIIFASNADTNGQAMVWVVQRVGTRAEYNSRQTTPGL